MPFFLSKLLPLFVYPVGLSCVLLAVALLIGRRRPRLQRVVIGVVMALLFVSGNKWVALGLVRSLEWRHMPERGLPEVDAIVVLGGSTHVSPIPLPAGASAHRLAHAAALYRAGNAPRILLSGGGPLWQPDTSEARRMASILAEMGIPESDLWLEEESRNTRENAVLAAHALEARGARRVILVTSALHMERAVRAFEQAGVEVAASPADFIVTRHRWRRLGAGTVAEHAINLVPSADNLELTTRALKEYYGLVIYRMRGWA